MQILNNQNSSYSYGINSTSSTQQVNTQNTTNSFDSYLTTSTKESSNTNQQTSKLVAFIEKHGGFSTLSPTDEKIFREILSDDKLTMEEMQNLTYEQIKKVEDLILPNYTTGISPNEIPIIKVTDSKIGSMLRAVKMTDNEDFNKALFETAQSIDNQIERMNFFDKLSNSLGFNDNTNVQKTIYNKTNDPKYLPEDEDWKINDYSKYIDTNINELDLLLKNKNILDEDKRIYKQVLDNFFTLQENYNEIKNEAKYI
jgi:hypothetical protein